MNALKHFWAVVWRSVKGIPRRIYRRLVPIPLTSGQLEFIERNAAFWQAMGTKDRQSRRDAYILVSAEGHPIIQLCDASFASIASHATGLRPLFVVTGGRNAPSTRLLRSYPGATLVCLSRWLSPLRCVVALWAAFRMYRIIRSPKDLLDLQLDGIRFGDVLYDAVLALGYATIDRIDGRTFQVLWRFYFLRSFIGYVIRRYPVRRAVFAHLIGLQGSTFSRYLLQQGIEVVNRVGSHEILLKKYRSLRDVGVFPVKPEPKYFNLMLRQDDGTILRLAEEYMERRFSKQVDQLSVDLAFDPRKRTFKTRQDFCTAYGLDDSRPVVFVLLHTFNDYPHSHFARPMIFQDYYHWFQRTLEIAREIRSVNWVFKEHPAAAYYITRDLELRSAFSGIREKNVLFLPSDADFNGRSVGNLAHAILTCIGTSGLEYATLGIPCVLGGDSQYSGLGFTLEPRDAGEYTEILHGIDRLERLQPEQIKAAKVTAYFYFCIMESARFHFCPHFSIKEISEWDAERSERLWQAAASGLRDESHRERLRRQIEELGDFVTDAARTQYVNLQQFPFLQGPESGQRLGGQAKSGSAFQRAVGTNRVYF